MGWSRMRGILRGGEELVNPMSLVVPCVIHENWARVTVGAQKWNV